MHEYYHNIVELGSLKRRKIKRQFDRELKEFILMKKKKFFDLHNDGIIMNDSRSMFKHVFQMCQMDFRNLVNQSSFFWAALPQIGAFLICVDKFYLIERI